MTVTIHPEILDGDQTGWVVQHAGVDEACAEAVADHQAAVQVLAAHNLDCGREMCATYGGDVVAVYGMSFPEVNISSVTPHTSRDCSASSGTAIVSCSPQTTCWARY